MHHVSVVSPYLPAELCSANKSDTVLAVRPLHAKYLTLDRPEVYYWFEK